MADAGDGVAGGQAQADEAGGGDGAGAAEAAAAVDDHGLVGGEALGDLVDQVAEGGELGGAGGVDVGDGEAKRVEADGAGAVEELGDPQQVVLVGLHQRDEGRRAVVVAQAREVGVEIAAPAATRVDLAGGDGEAQAARAGQVDEVDAEGVVGGGLVGCAGGRHAFQRAAARLGFPKS